MKEIVEYQILRAWFHIHCTLGKTVTNAIRDGWQVYGELQMCDEDLCQPMVKYGEKELQGDIKEYTTVTMYYSHTRDLSYDEHRQKFSRLVNEHIQKGYQPYGSLKMYIGTHFTGASNAPLYYLAQAMVKYG